MVTVPEQDIKNDRERPGGPYVFLDLCHPAKWKFWEICYLFIHVYD